MPLVFPVVRILQKLWGGPPGLRGSPWTRSSQRDQSHLNGKAGQGAVRGPGVRPTIFADRPVMGKTSWHWADSLQIAATGLRHMGLRIRYRICETVYLASRTRCLRSQNLIFKS